MKTNKVKSLGALTLTLVLAFALMSCADEVPDVGGGAIQLTLEQWKDGELSESKRVLEYKFSAEKDEWYYIWWNEEKGASSTPNGDGTKTANIKVSAAYVGQNVFSKPEKTGWTTPWYFRSHLTGTVVLKVELQENNGYGTFAICASADSGSATKDRPVYVPGPPKEGEYIPLVKNEWTNGYLVSRSSVEWYSIDVTQGETYYFWWNDGYDSGSGDGTKTAVIEASASYSDGSAVSSTFEGDYTAWNTPQSFTATKGGTVQIKVFSLYFKNSSGSTGAGSYGIVYNTTNTKPPILSEAIKTAAISLTLNEWENGSIATMNQADWYKVEVTSGTYYLWWNDKDAAGSKTGDIEVSAFNSSGTVVVKNKDAGWQDYYDNSRTPFTETIYIRVTAKGTSTGTYGIAYTSGTSRPVVPPAGTVPLTAGTWVDGTLPSSTSTSDWYSFEVENGKQYYVWLNQINAYSDGSGDGTKTGRVEITGTYNSGANVSALTSTSPKAFDTPLTFTAAITGTVYIAIKAWSYTYNNATYAIGYNTSNTKPTN